MSDLIERYLAAVGRELPERERADIVAELRDELLSGLEAKEEASGGPLTRKELEAALIDFGHPLVVAGRYRKVPHLIGPEIFPFWWAAVKATLVVIAAVYVVLLVLSIVAGGHASGGDLPSPVLLMGFALGAITFVCAMVERFGKPTLFARRWRPGRLPPVHGKTRTRFELLVEIGTGAVALMWWFGLIRFQDVWVGEGLRLELAPVWSLWFWPIAAYLTYELAMNLNCLLNPGRVVLNGALVVVRSLAGAGILTGVLQADRIVEVSSAKLAPSVLAVIAANFDRGFRVGITIAILVFLGMAVLQLWRLRRHLGGLRIQRAA